MDAARGEAYFVPAVRRASGGVRMGASVPVWAVEPSNKVVCDAGNKHAPRRPCDKHTFVPASIVGVRPASSPVVCVGPVGGSSEL